MFNIDICGINLQLEIKNYTAAGIENWCDNWCKCDFAFCAEDWLNYRVSDDELLLSSEVEELEMFLTMLLNDELKEAEQIRLVEPDFFFTLHPKQDLRKDPSCLYVQKGSEIVDIYMEWRVYFWHEGLTDNYLTIALGRDEITLLRDYLSSVIRNG